MRESLACTELCKSGRSATCEIMYIRKSDIDETILLINGTELLSSSQQNSSG